MEMKRTLNSATCATIEVNPQYASTNLLLSWATKSAPKSVSSWSFSRRDGSWRFPTEYWDYNRLVRSGFGSYLDGQRVNTVLVKNHRRFNIKGLIKERTKAMKGWWKVVETGMKAGWWGVERHGERWKKWRLEMSGQATVLNSKEPPLCQTWITGLWLARWRWDIFGANPNLA